MIRLQLTAVLQQTSLILFETANCRVTLRLHIVAPTGVVPAGSFQITLRYHSVRDSRRPATSYLLVTNPNLTCSACRERPAADALIFLQGQYNAKNSTSAALVTASRRQFAACS